MAKLPTKTLKDKLNSVVHVSFPRPHLGGSVIGHQCRRYVVYAFRWAYQQQIEAKLNRIFRLGDMVEEVLVKELSNLGYVVKGNQLKVGGYREHASGSIDGMVVIDGLNYLFESKSMNHNNFLEIVRKGCEESKPQYYRQCQIYMGKLELIKTLFIVMDKNTSDLYIEIIDFDEDEFDMLIQKEEATIDAIHIDHFPRMSENPAWYMCKFCDARFVCHHEIQPEKNCRTCKHVEIHDKGQWACGHYGEWLTTEQQIAGCKDWELNEMFINET